MGDRYAVVLLVDFLVIAVSMLLLSGWMLLYGLRIYTRLRVMNPASSADRTAAISALRRVNSVLLLLVVCATLRVFTLVILMVDIIRHSHDQDDLGILLWFIFSNWIPTLVPGCTLLYITRRVGLSNEQSDKASFLSSSGAALAVSSTTVPLTSDYASSSGGAVMATDSIYSSGRTLRVLVFYYSIIHHSMHFLTTVVSPSLPVDAIRRRHGAVRAAVLLQPRPHPRPQTVYLRPRHGRIQQTH